MSDNARKKIRFLIGTELAVIICLVSIWLVKTATVGIETTKATILTQVENANINIANELLPVSNSGNIEEKIRNYKEAVRTNPNDFDAYFGLGACYSDMGNEEEALKANKEAIKIRPDYPFARIALGLNYYNLGRYEDAIDTYRHALELDPRLADTTQTLINNAYAALGTNEETKI
jgi:tetratricopeptide (TPR) repeat protein